MCLAVSSDAYAKTIYLNTGGASLWETDNANKFAVWHWQGSGQGQWTGWMTKTDGNVWQVDIADGSDNVIFCRCNSSLNAPEWGDNKVWNKTADLSIPSGQNLYTITAWGNNTNVCPGAWSTYSQGGGDQPGGGGDQPGGGGGSGNTAGKNFYAMGWINNADAGESAYTVYDDQYKFVDGKLTINCTYGSYIGVKDDDGNTYYSKTKTTISDASVTLDWANGWSGCEKWAIPEGVNYIIMREVNFKGQIKLERVDKATYDAYHLDMGGGQGGGDDTYTPADYATAVPAQCEDVLLQAFYWNSYGGSGNDASYGTSTWTALKNHADEINSCFDMVWLAPSCRAKDNMGYLPMQYPNQNNAMGTEGELRDLMAAFHAGRTKVIADVVINHAGDQNWVNFLKQDFGTEYGSFSPQSTWITSNDEAQGHGTLGSHPDDGQESNANYPSARDWDHRHTGVQEMCRAYLKFLKAEMKYDGYRFDYAGGFHVSHIDDYVSSAKPYFSVMEYWNGDPAVLKQRIDDANRNTMTFDFAAFYTCFQQGIAANNYDKLKNAGLRGKGYSKYAVTFVDNHDTFNRADINNSDCGNSKDGHSSLNNKDLILQCNAYILSMPGVPCVFWPHWYTYKSEIRKLITARKKAGVHSESAVQEQSGNGWYKATVTGKYGTLILWLGSAANENAPAGYVQAIKQNKVAVYYTGEGNPNESVEQVPDGTVLPTKQLRNGRVVIIRDGKMYDVTGRAL